MNKFKKTYVVAPSKAATGGIELAHQLVDYLRNNDQDAYIVYVKGLSISKDQEITKEYIQYNIETSIFIEDKQDNILILPELYFDFIYKYKEIQIGCWWMSVDNRYKYCGFRDMFCFEKNPIEKLRLIKRLLCRQNKNKNTISFLKQEDRRIFHLYQSHYAQYHLYSLGFSKILPLSDYINTAFFEPNKKPKENIVLYNPKKGLKYTKRIMRLLPNYNFVPLKGFSRMELKNILERAKLYIDFGKFPGKDRLPREACLNNCCIVTGKFGASYFYEDIPIDEKYKFDLRYSKKRHVANMIKFILVNYDICNKDFDKYRKVILSEKQIFYNQIENIFSI